MDDLGQRMSGIWSNMHNIVKQPIALLDNINNSSLSAKADMMASLEKAERFIWLDRRQRSLTYKWL